MKLTTSYALVCMLIIHWQDPDAGDEYFDHLLTVTGVDSQFPDDSYHDTDVIHLEVPYRVDVV